MFERFIELFERLVIAAERIAAPVTADEDKPKRTRKPKEDQPAVVQPEFVPTPAVEAPATPLGSISVAPSTAVTVTQTAVEAPVATEAPKVERKDVSAALIAVAKSPELGPTKAFEVLGKYGAKEVKDLKEADYANIVADCQKLLG